MDGRDLNDLRSFGNTLNNFQAHAKISQGGELKGEKIIISQGKKTNGPKTNSPDIVHRFAK